LVVRQLTSYGGAETNGALSPDGRTFVFVSNHGGTPDIWLRQVGGGEPVRLTDDPVAEQELAFAPDGESIYFTRIEGGIPALWQTGVLGGQPRKVIDRAHAVAPAPDGERLAYFVPEVTAGETLVVSGIDGSGRRDLATRVPNFPPLRPAWSPDGRSLSYVRAGLFAPQNLFVVDLATGEERQVTSYEQPTEGIGQHQWLPNGRRAVAAFVPVAMALPNSDLALIDLRSGALERLTASVSESFTAPSLSLDGTRLLATSTRTVREVWKVPMTSVDPEVNGGAAAPLLSATADPMWTFVTRDGRTLLYAGTASGNRQLWTMPLDRSEAARQVTRVSGDGVTHSSLSPDGTRVAFVSFEAGTSDIWVQNVDGSNPRRLTADAAADSWPVWSPDGDRIVYTSAATSLPETRVMSADGTSNEKLLDGFFRGDWIRGPNGEGTLIVTSLSGPRSGIRLIDAERGTIIWEKEIPGMGSSLPVFSTDGRRLSASIAEAGGRTTIVVLDTDTGEHRPVASLPFPLTFRANWVDGDSALIVNRVETTSHIVLFDGISGR
jgi:Tol biopolymer transport system component